MYAIVATGGKQYRMAPGDVIQIEKLPGDVGTTVEFSHVHFIHGDTGIVMGQPLVAGARVTAQVLRQDRMRSITIFKKKRRKNYRRTNGHRQPFTQVKVTEIHTA